MKCPKCHFENPADTRFCGNCASPLLPSEEISVSQTKTIQTPVEKLTAGSIFASKYKVIEELGAGGMGRVYKAEDTKLRRTVALKFLSPELTLDSEARDRFVQEAQAASGLDHPNICTIHEIDETEAGQMYISMAYYKGESLKDRIKKGPLKIEEVVEIAVQAASGLAKAHEKGIIHRDIKPANIMITDEGLAKIVDFGLAKLAGTTRITRVGTTMGTVAYMSPEQAQGKEIDQRTDVWSLGVVLYEMITGQLPFKGEQEQAVIYSILNEEPEQVRGLPFSVPSELEQIMRRALSKDPARRFASAREMAQALEELKSKLIVGAALSTRRQIFRRSRKRILIGGIAGILVAAAVMATWILTRPSLAFSQRDKLLVADVENQTGDSVFDLALRTAIEADLQQSPYASIFDKGQVAETLRLMKMDPSSRIDEELGSDICRFSGVRAMVLPRILQAGEAFELQAILVDPRRRRHVDRIRVTAAGREDVLLHAIDKLVGQLRSHLGESLKSIEEADKSVVQVTTSSWEALHYFSMGQAKWQEGKMKDAATFYELALDKDPHFVAARGSLGLVLIQFLEQEEKGKEMLRQTFLDAKDLPQSEYLGIKAVNRQFVDEDLQGALDEYRIMSELYPDSMRAYNNSGIILRTLGRYDEAVAMFEKAAEVAPRNSIPLSNLWWTQLFYRKEPRLAEAAARKLVKLGPEIALYNNYLGYSLAAQAKFDEAIEVHRKTVSLEPEHPYGLPNLAHLLYASGKASEAVPFYRKCRELAKQGRMTGTYVKSNFDLSLALAESGDLEAAKQVAAEGREALLKESEGTSLDAHNLLLLGQFEAVVGRVNEAKQYLDKALKQGIKDQETSILLAELYALTGESELAIETLKKTLESGYQDPFFPLILPAFQSVRNDPRFRTLFRFDKERITRK